MFSMDGAIYRILSFVYRCMMLNLLYLVTSIFIVTIPVTTAGLFAVARKYVAGDEPPIWRTYWRAVRENLKHAYVAFLLFGGIAIIVWIDIRVFEAKHWAFSQVAVIVLAFIGLFATSTFMHIYPLMVHVHQSTRQLLMNAVRLNFYKPYLSLLNLVASVVWFFIATRVTIIFLIAFFSIWAMVVYWTANVKFKSILPPQPSDEALQLED